MCYTTFNNSWKEVRAMTAKPEARSSDPARLTALRSGISPVLILGNGNGSGRRLPCGLCLRQGLRTHLPGFGSLRHLPRLQDPRRKNAAERQCQCSFQQ